LYNTPLKDVIQQYSRSDYWGKWSYSLDGCITFDTN